MTSLPWLDPDQLWFPPAEQALDDPDGLLALGGDLSTERLKLAYRNGIFPWFSDAAAISPSPPTRLSPASSASAPTPVPKAPGSPRI